MNAGLLGMAGGPQRIVCLTEETTEWLYLLGEERRIAGISGYTVRPRRARDEKPKVSAFTSAKLDKILALEPDLVLGFSDMQADIAAVLQKESVRQKFAGLGVVPAGSNRADFTQAIQQETAKWAAIVKQAGIQPIQ